MKLLILSCGMGQGHNSAAAAVAEAAKGLGAEAQVVDITDFGGKFFKSNESIYNSLVKKKPKLFGSIYRAGELFNQSKIISPVYFANALYIKSLVEFITENAFDAVCCTHLYAMEAMTAIRKKRKLNIPSYAVITDYTYVPFLNETALDGYFIPQAELASEIVGKGLPADKLIASGIPVSKRFEQLTDKSAARNYLVIPQTKRVYLVMTGGEGGADVMSLCDEFLLEGDGEAYVLVGRNSVLMNQMLEKYGLDSHIHAITYTEKVNLYMRAADAVITKPGGLSSTEAAVANVPIVHYSPIPGCETKNVNFFASRGMSVCADTAKAAVEAARNLADNPERVETMLEMQRKYIPSNAAENIVRTIYRI